MEYDIRKGELSVNVVALNAKAEEPINIDITLPDYCPDIQRILKCQIQPIINLRTVNQDRLDIEGNVKVKLMYLDEDKKVLRCFDYSSPFSISLDIKNFEDDMINPIIKTKAKVEYVNCRAVSPRRLNVSGAFSINAKVSYKTFKSISTEINNDTIEQKNQIEASSEIINQGEKPFSINEILEITDGKPKIGNIIRSEVTPVIYESRTIANKLVLKGEIIVKVMYKADLEENQIENMEYSLPLSQIIDMEGLEDDTKCMTSIEVLESNIEPRTDSSGEDTLIECELKLLASIVAYKERNINIISDVYSKEYELNTEYKNITLQKILEPLKINCEFSEEIDISDKDIKEICCIFNDINQVSATVQDDDICFKGKYNICMIISNQNDELMYIEKMMDFVHMYRMECPKENLQLDSDIKITSINYRIKGPSQIEVKVMAEMNTEVIQNQSIKCLDYITSDESKKRIKDEKASIIIYYAQKGESIWDIAMNYASSVRDIKEANDITDEILSDSKMLLIPV